MNWHLKFLFSLLFILTSTVFILKGQVSDDFSGAELISISNNSYGTGKFQSTLTCLKDAGVEPSEFFPDDLIRAGNINKTVWFKFQIGSNRDVNIILKQMDSAILQSDVGITIYENPNGWAGQHSLCKGLPALTKFGSVGNTCLKSGEYYIQVCARTRVIDSIFIELDIRYPNEPYSDYTNPKEVSFPNNIVNVQLTNIASCAYVPSENFYPLQSLENYNRAINWRFKFTSPNDIYKIDMSGFTVPTNDRFLFLVLKEDPNKAIKDWAIVDSASVYTPYFFKEYGCLSGNILDTGTYRGVFLYKDVDFYTARINNGKITNNKIANNAIPSQLETNHILGKISDRNLIDTFHCLSNIENSGCLNLRQDALYYISQTDSIFHNLQAWYTFKVTNDIIVQLDPNNNQSGLSLLLYDGDITKSCQLSLSKRRTPYGIREYCLKPGTYSIRVLRYSQGGLAALNQIRYDFRVKLIPITNDNFLFADSLAPEVMGEINGTTISSLTSSNNYFSIHNQSVVIAKGDTSRGNMIYREFHYTGTAPLEFFVNYQAILFKGRKSLGEQTAFKAYWSRNKTFYCSSLDTGWYTVVQIYGSYNNTRECLSLNDPQDLLQIKTALGCQNATFGTINNPEKLSASPIFAANTIIDGVVYPETREYTLSKKCLQCFDESEKLNNFINDRCAYLPKFDALGSVEFELGEEFDLFLNQTSNLVLLIRGSLKDNPDLLYDTNAHISPCIYNYNYCRLQPQRYTLVVFALYPVYNYQLKFSFIPTRTLSNTEIEKPEDLGQVIGQKESKPYLFNCLIFNDTSANLPEFLSGRPYSTKVEYPYSDRSLLFYTFHTTGTGSLKVSHRDELYLYRLDDGFDYQAVMNNPQKRDSIINHMKLVGYSNSNSSTIQIPVSRCGRTDFLIILRDYSWRYIPENKQIEVQFTPSTTQPSAHDFCSTAQLLNISSTGSFSEKFDVRCTTIGEGFGEDGNNLACLPDDKEFGTFWAKIVINPGSAYDVNFKLSALPGISFGNEVKYRILYGSCNGLNPGPCLSSMNTYIGFDCMEPGEYFLQIAVPKEIANSFQSNEFLKLDVDVIPPKSLTCKPFNPRRPIASFNFTGNCTRDSVKFQNYSSQGSEIEYLWDFGDGVTSTAKDPRFWYAFTGTHKDYKVKLWVTNTVYNLTDSFERFVRVWRDPLTMELNFIDTTIQCNEEIFIEAKSNLPDVFFYHVLIPGNDTIVNSKVQRSFNTDSEVRFIMFTAGCYVDSTVKVNIDHNLNKIPKDTLICGLQDLVLDVSPYKLVYWQPGFISTPQYTVIKEGIYSVTTRDSGCIKTDTFSVREYRRAFEPVIDTVLCNVDSFKLTLPNYLQQVLWYDQSTGYQKWVSNSNNYGVSAYWDDCLLYDTAIVRFSDIRNPIIKTTDTFCLNTSIEIGTDEFASNYLWNTGATTNKILADTAGLYKLTLSSGNCTNTDSIDVFYHPKTYTIPEDTGGCGDYYITFDAGIGINYLWRPFNSTDRYLTVRDSGIYSVSKINIYGCEEIDTFTVFENCGPYFLIPNAFTPNGDGDNDILVWANQDITEFRISIFNRWGELLYKTENPLEYWNGIYKNTPLPSGVYFYRVTYGGFDYTGRYFKRNQSGNITLIR